MEVMFREEYSEDLLFNMIHHFVSIPSFMLHVSVVESEDSAKCEQKTA